MPALPAVTALIPTLDDDDHAFCALAERTIRGVVVRFEPNEIIVVRIDRWFGRAWLGFAGKFVGAVGFTKTEGPWTPIPPFVPARVRSQRNFQAVDGSLRELPASESLHVRQPSERNERRRISRLMAGRTLIAWISGGSSESGRGAIMVYAWDPPEQLAYWYAGAARLGDGGSSVAWGWVQTANVSRAELAAWGAA